MFLCISYTFLFSSALSSLKWRTHSPCHCFQFGQGFWWFSILMRILSWGVPADLKNPFILFYNFLLKRLFCALFTEVIFIIFSDPIRNWFITLFGSMTKCVFSLQWFFFSAHYQFFFPYSVFKELQVYFLLHYLYVKERISSWNIYLKNINSQACLQEDPTPFIKTQIVCVCVCRAGGGRDNREAEIFICCVHSCHPKD